MLSFFLDVKCTLRSASDRRHLPHPSLPRCSEYGLQNSSISTAWRLLEMQNLRPTPGYWIRIPPFTRTPLFIIHDKYCLFHEATLFLIFPLYSFHILPWCTYWSILDILITLGHSFPSFSSSSLLSFSPPPPSFLPFLLSFTSYC